MSSNAPMQFDNLGGTMILMLICDCAFEGQGLGPNRVVQDFVSTETVSNLSFKE